MCTAVRRSALTTLSGGLRRGETCQTATRNPSPAALRVSHAAPVSAGREHILPSGAAYGGIGP